MNDMICGKNGALLHVKLNVIRCVVGALNSLYSRGKSGCLFKYIFRGKLDATESRYQVD